jgi:hypothetical protein
MAVKERLQFSPPRCQSICFIEVLHSRACQQLGGPMIPVFTGIMRHF